MSRPPSRPVRAMQGAAVLLTLAVVVRVPAIERRFAAALTTADDPPHGRERHRTPHAAAPATGAITTAAASTGWPASSIATPGGQAAVHAVIASGSPPEPTSPSPGGTPGLAAEPPPAVAPATIIVAPAALATDTLPVSAETSPPPTDAGALATAAYASLAAGDRRGAVRLFDAALRSDDPRAGDWRRQRDDLTRRWSASAYSIVRGSGPTGLAVEPVLGGGQSGVGVAYTLDPLARRPLAATARGSVAHDDGGRSGFAAVGVAWHPLTGVTLAAERLIAVGPAGPDAWTVRVAAGVDRARGRLRLTAYGEGGLIGAATYAAVQGRAAAIVRDHGVEFDPGTGLWASRQHDRVTVDRVDLGPGVVVRSGPLAVEVDYRVRVAGNAAPGSGPVLTLSAAF